MFMRAFFKTASTLAQISPEEYYELKHDKYPPQAALAGAATGAALGAARGKKGKRERAALIGAGLGAAGAGLATREAVKALNKYKRKKLEREIAEMHLRSMPSRQRRHDAY